MIHAELIGGHAIDAAEIAAIRHRNPQISQRTLEPVDTRTHARNLSQSSRHATRKSASPGMIPFRFRHSVHSSPTTTQA
jgi:hypothetical protein